MRSSPERMPLWPSAPPGQLHAVDREETRDGMIFQTFRPTLSLVRPTAASIGWTTVLCPGGGFNVLAWEQEGIEAAHALAALGITCAILAYRLRDWQVPTDDTVHQRALSDAQRAIRTVRSKAGAWGVDPARIAIGGFSAGGCLSALAAAAADSGRREAEDPIERESSQVQALWLVYADLLPVAGDQAMPPSFLVHGANDQMVPVQRSSAFFELMTRRKHPSELHLFQDGEHGFGVGTPGHPTAAWPSLFAAWLQQLRP